MQFHMIIAILRDSSQPLMPITLVIEAVVTADHQPCASGRTAIATVMAMVIARTRTCGDWKTFPGATWKLPAPLFT